MKTNLRSRYGTDTSAETAGIWMEVEDGVAFKVKRFGGKNASAIKRAIDKYHKPYARQIEKGILSEEKEAEIYTTAFVESALTDWRGVEIDGEEVPFSREAAIELLLELPELLAELSKEASNVDNYKEDLGNS